MSVVGVGVGAGQWVGATSFSVQGNGLALGTFENLSALRPGFERLQDGLTRIVGTANCDTLAELVLYIDVAGALDAQRVKRRVCHMKFSARARQSANGLTGRTLCFGPLRFLVACGTGVRAHGTLDACLPFDGVPDQVPR